MTRDASRLGALWGALDAHRLELAERAGRVREVLESLAETTSDPRLTRALSEIQALESGLLAPSRLGEELERLEPQLRAARLGGLLAAVAQAPKESLAAFSCALLDAALSGFDATRGFVLFAFPGATEAQVVAARSLETLDLTVAQHAVSRSIVVDVLSRGEAVLVDDATRDARYSGKASVRRLDLRAVLAVPLSWRERAVGVLYLESSAYLAAFTPDDAALLLEVAGFTVERLEGLELLPHAPAPLGRVRLVEGGEELEILGHSRCMEELRDRIRRIADAPATVLVQGETGTGKELVARALHAEGSRRDRPFVAVNCAAIPESLLESELFGHERGAFTGAAARYLGRVETAEGGTLFLDEVGEMPLAVQAKLLRFLQSGEVVRLGGGAPRRVDVRVVAAASKPLKDLVSKGLILDALYYRLNVVPLLLPPLRERGEDDIRLLATHFLERWAGIYHRDVAFDPETLALLTAHTYPGNVRELENLVHRLVALARGPLILPGDLPEELHRTFAAPASAPSNEEAPSSLSALEARRRQSRHLFSLWEARLAERAVAEAGGNVSEAAQRLGVHRATLHRMLRRGEDS